MHLLAVTNRMIFDRTCRNVFLPERTKANSTDQWILSTAYNGKQTSCSFHGWGCHAKHPSISPMFGPEDQVRFSTLAGVPPGGRLHPDGVGTEMFHSVCSAISTIHKPGLPFAILELTLAAIPVFFGTVARPLNRSLPLHTNDGGPMGPSDEFVSCVYCKSRREAWLLSSTQISN